MICALGALAERVPSGQSARVARQSLLGRWDRRNQRVLERSGEGAAPPSFTGRRHALLAAGLSIPSLAFTAHDSWSLWRGLIAGVVAYPFMALALLLVRRTGLRPQLTAITLMLAMPFLCSIGIGQSLPKRGGDGPPAPTGSGLVGLLLLVALAAFALAAIVILLSRREHDGPP
jgi:hypothetical protein